jgi:allatostatin A receptor
MWKTIFLSLSLRPFGDAMCKTVQYMIVVTCLASVYTLVLMSLDRFLAVVHPISSMSIRTEKNALMYVKYKMSIFHFTFRATILAWVFIFTTAIPTAICHGEITYMHKGVNHTACLFLEDGYNHSLFQVSLFDVAKKPNGKMVAILCGVELMELNFMMFVIS